MLQKPKSVVQEKVRGKYERTVEARHLLLESTCNLLKSTQLSVQGPQVWGPGQVSLNYWCN